MRWRQEFLRGVTPSAADVAAEAATAKAYLHAHRDINGRPVIVIRASRHITGKLCSCNPQNTQVLCLIVWHARYA